jgi:methionyl aminopeptidase
METADLKKWREAGKMAGQLMAYAKKIAKPGMPLLEIAEKVEAKAAELKTEFAFPVNLSINEIAAHFTPTYDDKTIASGLLKIDIGANINGFISDTACSVDLTPDHRHSDLIKASEYALNEAIRIIRPGITLGEIGGIIQETAKASGAIAIRNLGGHELDKWHLHAGLSIPTHGDGIVQDGAPSGIYRFERNASVRDANARKILEYIEKEYKELPFSGRWIVKKFGTRALFSLRLLEQAGALHHFMQLVETSKSPVSQAEHTILVTKDGCEVLTKIE